MKNSFNKNKFDVFVRILRYDLTTSFKSERTWVINLILFPIIVLGVVFSYSFYVKTFILLPPQIFAIMLTSPILVCMYFSIVFIEKRNSLILSHIKFSGGNQFHIITSISLISLFFSIISLLVSFIELHILYVIYQNLDYSFGFNFSYLSNLDWYNWFYFVVGFILIVFMLMPMLIFFSNLVNNKNISLILIFIVSIIALFFSDIIIISYISSRNKFMAYVSYIVLTKYIVWFVMLTASYTFIDSEGIQQLIKDPHREETHIFINSSFLCLFISLLFVCIMTYLSIINFKWMERG